MVVTPCDCVGSIRYRVPVVLLTTHTNPPPTATPFGATEKPSPTAGEAESEEDSMDWTVPSSKFATQMVDPAAAMAMGVRPTPIDPRTLPFVGSIRTTVFTLGGGRPPPPRPRVTRIRG